MSFVVLVPARLASTRLPDKPLADIGGKPMIVRVAERAALSGAARVVVACDDPRIQQACADHGVAAVLTRRDHASGSDRLAEACQLLGLAGDECVVNVQGDEPLIDPALVHRCAQLLDEQPDCVMSTAAHPITELADSALERAATALWQQTSGALVIVEPGRPRDFARLLTIRTVLVGQGATVLAPCPHGAACPLAAPDWCHFSVRLPRSRAHVQMKGASLGYEDEKFSYLVVARPGLGVAAEARLIKPPHVSKHTATLPLCTTDGLRTDSISSRDPARFKAARKLDWGDVSRF